MLIAGPEQAAVVVLGVDVGDAEPPGVQRLGEVQHRRDVALRRVRDEHRVGARVGAHRGFALLDDAAVCYRR